MSIRRGITAALLEMYNSDALTCICGARGGGGGVSGEYLIAFSWPSDLIIDDDSVICRALHIYSALEHPARLTWKSTPDSHYTALVITSCL